MIILLVERGEYFWNILHLLVIGFEQSINKRKMIGGLL